MFGDAGKLCNGESMDVGNKEGTDIAAPLSVERRTIYFQPSEWIRSVEDDHFDAIFKAGLHGVAHTTDIGVGTHANILQIDDEGIQAR